ncbi:MAG: hypothetical protein WAL47_00365 [Pyrinomonadaceae bacterium]
MFCPRCGANQTEDLKFCKTCGVNLHAVRQVVQPREGDKKFDWSDTWVAEMFLSGSAHERRKLELERARGLTPEVKRYNEIKAGVITGSSGLAMMIFLFVMMAGIISGGKIPNDTAEILSRVWIVGVIPLFIGIALIINGVFVSKKIVEAANRNELPTRDVNPNLLRPTNTAEFMPTSFSVTEETTRQLRESERK